MKKLFILMVAISLAFAMPSCKNPRQARQAGKVVKDVVKPKIKPESKPHSRYKEEEKNNILQYAPVPVKCPVCKGKGENSLGRKCSKCNGTGVVWK